MTRMDVNKDGKISRDDYELMAEKLIESSKMTTEQAQSTRQELMNVADAIGLKPDVKRSVEEAAKIASDTMLAMSFEKQQAVLNASHNALFNAIDTNKDGHISVEEFKIYLKVIAPDISEEEITHSFNVIDSDGNGMISREEFLAAAFDFMFGLEETEVSNAFLGHLLF